MATSTIIPTTTAMTTTQYGTHSCTTSVTAGDTRNETYKREREREGGGGVINKTLVYNIDR